MDGGHFSSSTLNVTPRLCAVFGLVEEYHSISTLPTSHYEYNEWLENIEIVTGGAKVGYLSAPEPLCRMTTSSVL
eukprot:scaffold43037_cov48-Cyclotella_meneghiniana.AAC.1